MKLILPEKFFEDFAAECAQLADFNSEALRLMPGGIRQEMLKRFEDALKAAWRTQFPFKGDKARWFDEKRNNHGEELRNSSK